MIRKNIYLLAALFIVTGMVLLLSGFQVWGQDGFHLWMPIVAEFLRGSYHPSDVIFGGQDLLGVYGELPFWHLLKWLGFSPIAVLNATYLVVLGLFWYFSRIIYLGLRKEESFYDEVLVFLYSVLSPIFINRLYSGHFNLLFGMLPLLVAISFFYQRDLLHKVVSLFALACAFSVQGYQIIAYHFFYIPLWIVWIRKEETNLKNYFKDLFPVILGAFLLALPAFLAMVTHAGDKNNLRSFALDVVYSYIVSDLRDLGALVFSSYNSLTAQREFAFFHEINYPFLMFFLAAIFVDRRRNVIIPLALTTFFITVFVILFSANFPGVNLLSKLPLIKLFRVPQRGMMLAAYLLPLIVTAGVLVSRTSIMALLLGTLAVNLVPFSEFIFLAMATGFLLIKSFSQYRNLAMPLLLVVIFTGLPRKLEQISEGNRAWNYLEPLVIQLKTDLNLAAPDKIVHFESPLAFPLTVIANYHGIKTVEGYGHPPTDLLLKITQVSTMQFSPMANSLHINSLNPQFREIMLTLGVTDVVYVAEDGKVFTKKTQNL